MQNIKDFPAVIKGAHFHLVGIKGTGVAALAELLASFGAVVTGSDVPDVFYTDEILKRLNIRPLAFSSKNITDDIDCVVHSSAYSEERNSDLIEAKKRGIPIYLYTEALGVFSSRAYSVGICGVHGKTSTTGLTGTILQYLPLPAQVLAGSVITSFNKKGASCVMTSSAMRDVIEREEGDGRSPSAAKDAATCCRSEAVCIEGHYFVAETCEYQRHFMSFHPEKILLTSVESDHQDYYPSYEDILEAFVDYLCLLPYGGEVIYCADDKGAYEAVKRAKERRGDLLATPYGFLAKGDYHITLKDKGDGVQRFTLDCMSLSEREGEASTPLGNAKDDILELYISGRHEVQDAAGAIAVSRALLIASGKDPAAYNKDIQKGVADFRGGKRRSEVTGHCKNRGQDIIFIDDYGHHPTAIRTTLQGYREFYSGRRIVVDFMSHTYTRTSALLKEFAQAFESADDVIINKIYGSAREDAKSAAVTGEVLAKETALYHPHVIYAGEFSEAAKAALDILKENTEDKYPNGYLFVTMGAGDNWKVGEMVRYALKD